MLMAFVDADALAFAGNGARAGRAEQRIVLFRRVPLLNARALLKVLRVLRGLASPEKRVSRRQYSQFAANEAARSVHGQFEKIDLLQKSPMQIKLQKSLRLLKFP